jgi:hypothetical protein
MPRSTDRRPPDMQIFKGAALALAMAAAGYTVGVYRSAPAAPLSPKTERAADTERASLRAEIAAAVRGELAQLQSATLANAPIAPAASPPPAAKPSERDDAELAATPSNPEARSRAEAIVNDAMHFARWTEHDRTILREQLAELHGDDWLAVTTPLAAAINNGKLVVETSGMPF